MFLYRWYQKFKVIRRFNYILLVLFRAGFSAFVYQAGLKRHIPLSQRLDQKKVRVDDSVLPQRLRLTLQRLGPVFVKFGQILSTRTDLLPKAYIEELAKLQSQVEPFSYREAEKIVQKNLGRPVAQVFKSFDREPFASASLGQVYKAQLKGGETVAVKVQRPRAKQQIRLDSEVLLMLAHFVERHVPGAKDYSLVNIVREFQRWTVNELDYRKEATNCEIFANFFKDDPWIYTPKVYWDYSGDSVLCLEYVQGAGLGDVLAGRGQRGVNKKLVAHRLADSFIRQYFDFGYFHADPHPGNIFILPGNKLLFLDFGMIGLLDSQLTALASAAFLALLQRDVEKIVAILLQVEENYDERAQGKDVRELINVNGLRKEVSLVVLEWASTGKAGEFTRLFYQVVDAAIRNGIGVPVDLTLFSKSIMTLDAVAHDLDPKLKIEEWERPLVEKIILDRFRAEKIKDRTQTAALAAEELLKKLPDSTANIISNLERGRFGMELNAEQLLQYERLLNANSRFSTYGTFLAALLIAVALIYQSGTHPLQWKVAIPGWGLYLGLLLIVLFLLRVRRRSGGAD
ncbi:MAG: AarF/ABC1/UbiB kinase family protein [Patescibacteria group bacterium]|nr:AarF/ABC1/UbiB kinase family protein [Patescibacteria group bacterium]